MRKKAWILIILLSLMAIGLSACTKNTTAPPAQSSTNTTAPVAQPLTQEITLYFADDQAMYLVPEKRSVQVEKADDLQKLAEIMVKELINGPKDARLYPTFPTGTRLLSLKIDKNTAFVDFSKELQSKHSGGSSGEMMTAYSLINSLTELPGIQKVQILVEGQKPETLAGNLDTTQPLTRDPSLIKK